VATPAAFPPSEPSNPAKLIAPDVRGSYLAAIADCHDEHVVRRRLAYALRRARICAVRASDDEALTLSAIAVASGGQIVEIADRPTVAVVYGRERGSLLNDLEIAGAVIVTPVDLQAMLVAYRAVFGTDAFRGAVNLAIHHARVAQQRLTETTTASGRAERRRRSAALQSLRARTAPARRSTSQETTVDAASKPLSYNADAIEAWARQRRADDPASILYGWKNDTD